MHFRTFRTSYPIALCFFQRICPIYSLQSVKQTLCICRYSQTPLIHQFLFYRISSAQRHSFTYFIICQYGSQFRTPIHHRITQISQAIIHQYITLFLICHFLPFCRGKLQIFGTCCIYFATSVFFKF